MHSDKITVEDLRAAKVRGEKIAALTAYDYPLAKLLDEAGVPVLLVGDSLGMVVLGFPDTTHVTLAHMIHHVAAVARARTKALVVADLPFRTYENSEQAVVTARSLMEAGAQAVKLEGGLEKEAEIYAIAQAGIPVMGHLGMLPQSIQEEGGVYRIKGKKMEEAEYLQKSARVLVQTGVFAIVLELIEPRVAQAITEAHAVPTIGIGSGESCDGQILVTHDLIGLFPWFRPKFAQPAARVAEEIKRAAREFRARII